MEYAWGIAASKTPFPAEFASAARSKPKATSTTSQPLPPPETTSTSPETTSTPPPAPSTKAQPASPPLPSSSSTRTSRLRIPGHSRPPLTHATQSSSQSQSQSQADPSRTSRSRSPRFRSRSNSSSRFGSRSRSKSRDQGCDAALMSPDNSRSPGLLPYEFLSRVSSHPVAPSAPSALTHDDRRRPASATIGSHLHLHRSRSRSGRSSTTSSATNTTTNTASGRPDRDAAHPRAQQRPASTSAAVGSSSTSSGASGTVNNRASSSLTATATGTVAAAATATTATSATATTFQDKQLPALPTEASTSSSSSSPRRAPDKACDAIDGYDDNVSTSYPGPQMSRASSTLSYADGASHRDWQGDHNSAVSATAPLLSAPPTSGSSSQHRRPPSLKPSSTAVCDASKKSRSPLSFSRSRAQHQLSAQHHHNHNHNPPSTPDGGASHRLVHNHELSRKPPSTHWANAASSSTPSSTPSATDPPARKRDRRQSNHATMVGTESIISSRTESVAESVGGRTIMSSEPPYREGDGSSTRSLSRPSRPFVTKSNGRTYLADPTLAYPLPVDLHELHRQSLRTLLLFQLFGGPLCSPFFNNKPPTRVLDVGCAYGFWSMMCHSYYSRKGFPNVHFTGLDIAALGGIAGMPHVTGPPGGPKDRVSSTTMASTSTSSSGSSTQWAEQPPDKNMRWNFVQHDLRILPLPFADEEFDVVMCKDMSMTTATDHFSLIIDEFMRILKPGGALEVWECDHPIRMLRPHVPDTPATGPGAAPPPTPNTEDSAAATEESSTPTTPATPATTHGSSKKADYEKEVAELGAYVINNNTPLSGPQNNYLIEYNGWVSKYMDANKLLTFPCANVGALMVQEPLLTSRGSKRLAIPLSEVRWEREGVGGVVTKDGKSYIDTSKAIGKAAAAAAAIMGGGSGSAGGKRGSSAAGGDGDDGSKKGKALSTGQLALRQTALQTVVQLIEGLEPALREVSGKKPDEWDTWMGKLMKELIERDGTSCGECLEVGAWWARKKQDPPA